MMLLRHQQKAITHQNYEQDSNLGWSPTNWEIWPRLEYPLLLAYEAKEP